MKSLHTKLPNKLSVWSEFNQLCLRYNSLNLSHGRPSVYPPEYLLQHTKELSSQPEIHQYTNLWGHPELQSAVANYFSPKFNRTLKQNKEILVTPGGMAAHFAAIFGIATEPNDEVFSFAPFFPTYLNQALLSGVKFRSSKLIINPETNKWEINYEDLLKNLNSNTRIIMLNSPHNPTGKIFTEEEYLRLSKIFDQHAPNAVIVNDVVYENLIYDDNKYVRFANILDNWKRTVSVYSAGKMMSCTGWKVGWLIGPSEYITACAIVNESIAFQTNTICQIAIARSLPQFDTTPSYGFPTYTAYMVHQFQASRDILYKTLLESKLGIVPFIPQGGYFLIADVSKMQPLIDEVYYSKDGFCDNLEGIDYKKFENADKPYLDYVASRYLALKHKIAPMPGSLFYSEDNFDEKYVRFAICQTVDKIEEAKKRIQTADESL